MARYMIERIKAGATALASFFCHAPGSAATQPEDKRQNVPCASKRRFAAPRHDRIKGSGLLTPTTT